MRSKSMHKWMSNEMERLTMKLERYKPTGSGYNRIQPILLSKSVTHMLNNPLPAEDQIGGNYVKPDINRCKGVLSRSESEWEEVYPTVQFSRNNSRNGGSAAVGDDKDGRECSKKFAYYRNCSTRIT